MRQGLTQKEFDWLRRIEREIDKVWDDLTPWERKFMENRLEDFRKYGISLRVSKAQWNIITRISEKIV